MIKQILIAIDQLLNTLLGGWADETLSSRIWRLYARDKLSGRILKPVIDTIFFFQKDHCYQAFLSEVNRRQLPRDFQEIK
jgi:hypothetical protein